ncbi:MAG: cysteine--tRNA ligase [Bacteroidales bacterium]|nr:cysteine--tRNA ligase [Bacteroidales bacterium]MCF8391262.1 cysteine--tRNA ligase [Bacteroidales bacterium]
MMQKLFIHNTLSRKKEEFKPLNPPNVGLYVCGPTVYGDAHLGHARPAITFDLLFRYLKHLGFKVRYVRNITDVGHLENDSDAGEDKIAQKARLQQLEPMEVVQFFTNQYHDHMKSLNTLPPSIEPQASGHIIEQQSMVRQILKNDFAYESGGSVYFDVEKYNKKHNYGILSGRKTDELLSNTRQLEGQEEKKSPMDFAIWKKADERHIMKWPSEWSEGFPGWHLECSVMSTKYLGEKFDIHGGGLDLLFPHHECEIAQSVAANGEEAVKYWMHNNMITINGQKMGRSLGNFITLDELFAGTHKLLEQAYSPMTIRFFMLQAHYRSTLDFSNHALQAAEKGLERMFEGAKTLKGLSHSEKSSFNITDIINSVYEAISDDLNSPIAIAKLFDAVRYINLIKDGKESLNQDDLNAFKEFFPYFLVEILGLKEAESSSNNLTAELIESILEIRQEAKNKKDFFTSDLIRDKLILAGVEIKDGKDKTEWKFKSA